MAPSRSRPRVLTSHHVQDGSTTENDPASHACAEGKRSWCKAAIPNLVGTRDQFCGRQFSHGPEWGKGAGFRMFPLHCIQAPLLL